MKFVALILYLQFLIMVKNPFYNFLLHFKNGGKIIIKYFPFFFCINETSFPQIYVHKLEISVFNNKFKISVFSTRANGTTVIQNM